MNVGPARLSGLAPAATVIAAFVQGALLLAASPARADDQHPTEVFIHLEGDDAATLEVDTTGRNRWSELCQAPCDRLLAPDLRYRIAGRGLRRSHAFALTGPVGGRETIRAEGASSTWFAVSFVTTVVGVATVIVGTAVVEKNLPDYNLAGAKGGNPVTVGYGLATIAAGTALAGLSLFVLLTNGASRAIQHTDQPPRVDPEPETAPSNEARRSSWQEGSRRAIEEAALPRAFGVPILVLTF